MDAELLLTVAVTAAGALVSVVASDAWRVTRAGFARLLGRDVPDKQKLDEAQETTADPLLDRLEQLRAQLSESALLLPTLQAELELRIAALDRLQADAAHYERLAALHREEAEAVQRLVEQTVGQGLTETVRRSGRQQALYFAAGLASSIPLGVAANIVYSWVTQ